MYRRPRERRGVEGRILRSRLQPVVWAAAAVDDDELFMGLWLTGDGLPRRPWGEALYSLASGGQKESAQTGAFRQRHACSYSRSLPWDGCRRRWR